MRNLTLSDSDLFGTFGISKIKFCGFEQCLAAWLQFAMMPPVERVKLRQLKKTLKWTEC